MTINWGDNTTTKTVDGVFTMTFYETDIVVYDKNTRTLSLHTGGFNTTTTKRRMNDAIEFLQLPYRVYQNEGEWYIKGNDQIVKFVNCRAIVMV